MRSKKSQSIFDYALAFIALAGLTVGIVRTWVWFNANYAKRQIAYQTSRLVAAGRSWQDIDAPYPAPVDIGATMENPDNMYQPLALDNNWVFGGRASGSIGAAATGSENELLGGLVNCGEYCVRECTPDTACWRGGEFNLLCGCYQVCFAHCNCLNQTSPMVGVYAQQVTAICGPDNNCNWRDPDSCHYEDCETEAGCGQACGMRLTAQSMNDAAIHCGDTFWHALLCAFAGGRRTANELNKGARQLVRMAWQQEFGAKALARSSQRLQDCCEQDTDFLVGECMISAQSANELDSKCMAEALDAVERCGPPEDILLIGTMPLFIDIPCFYAAENYHAFCTADGTAGSCADKVHALISGLHSLIDTLEDDINVNEELIGEIDEALRQAAITAEATCSAVCANTPNCYDYCYAQERDKYCMENCCQGEGWGRACDGPIENCDNCGEEPSCPKCGLSQLRVNVQDQINDTLDIIDRIQRVIRHLPDCCGLPNLPGMNTQDACINWWLERIYREE